MIYKYFSNDGRDPTKQKEFDKSTWYLYQLYVQYRCLNRTYLKGKRIRKGLYIYNLYKYPKFSLFWKNVEIHNSYFNNNFRKRYAIIIDYRRGSVRRIWLRIERGYFRLKSFLDIKYKKAKYFFNPFFYLNLNNLYKNWEDYYFLYLHWIYLKSNLSKTRIGQLFFADLDRKFPPFRRRVHTVPLKYYLTRLARVRVRRVCRRDRTRRHIFDIFKKLYYKVNRRNLFLTETKVHESSYYTNEFFFWTPTFRYLKNLFYLHGKKAPWYWANKRAFKIQFRELPSRKRKMRKRINIFRYKILSYFRHVLERWYIAPKRKGKPFSSKYRKHYQERFNILTTKYALFFNKLKERYFLDFDYKNRFWIDGFLNYCKNWIVLYPKRRNEYLANLRYDFSVKTLYLNGKLSNILNISSLFTKLIVKHKQNIYNKYSYTNKIKNNLFRGIIFYLNDTNKLVETRRYFFSINKKRSILNFFLAKIKYLKGKGFIRHKRDGSIFLRWYIPLTKRMKFSVRKIFRRIIVTGRIYYKSGENPFFNYKWDNVRIVRRVVRFRCARVYQRYAFKHARRCAWIAPLHENKYQRNIYIPLYYFRRLRFKNISFENRGIRRNLTKLATKKIHESKVPSFFFFWKRVWVNDTKEDIFLYFYFEYLKNINKMYHLYSKNLLWYDKLYNIGVNTEAYGVLYTKIDNIKHINFWKLFSTNNFIFNNDCSVSTFDFFDYSNILPFLHINRLSFFDLVFNPKRQGNHVAGLFYSYFHGFLFKKVRVRYEMSSLLDQRHFWYLKEELFENVSMLFEDESQYSNKTGRNFSYNLENGIFQYQDEFIYYYAPISYAYSYLYCLFSVFFIGFLHYLRYIYYHKYNPLFVEEYLFLRKHIYWSRFSLVSLFFSVVFFIFFFVFVYDNSFNLSIFHYSSLYFQKYDFILFIIGQFILLCSSLYLYLTYIIYIKYTKWQFMLYIICNSFIFITCFYIPFIVSKLFLYNKLITIIPELALYNTIADDIFYNWGSFITFYMDTFMDEDILTPIIHYLYTFLDFTPFKNFSIIYFTALCWWVFMLIFDADGYFKDGSDYDADEIDWDTLNTENSQINIENSALYLVDKLENNVYYDSIYLLDHFSNNVNNYSIFLKKFLEFESNNELQILYEIIERNNIDLVTLVYLSMEELGNFFYSEGSLISINTDDEVNGEIDDDDLDIDIFEDYEEVDEDLDDLDDYEVNDGEADMISGSVTATDVIMDYRHWFEESEYLEDELFDSTIDFERYIYYIQNYHYLLNFLRKEFLIKDNNLQISHILFDFMFEFNILLSLQNKEKVLTYKSGSDLYMLMDELYGKYKSNSIEDIIFNYFYSLLYGEFDDEIEEVPQLLIDLVIYDMPSDLAIMLNLSYNCENTDSDPLIIFDFDTSDYEYSEVVRTEIEEELLYEYFELNSVSLSFLYDFTSLDITRDIYFSSRITYFFLIPFFFKVMNFYYTYLPVYHIEFYLFSLGKFLRIERLKEVLPEDTDFRFIDLPMPDARNYTKYKLQEHLLDLRQKRQLLWTRHYYRLYYKELLISNYLYSHMYILNKKRRPIYYCIYI